MRAPQRELQLNLYVVGRTPRAERAIANLRRICGPDLEHCEITIIDVLEQPELAETHKVIATPTLVKRLPPPTRRIIGDLSDIQRVADLLGLNLGEPSHETFGTDEEGAL
jgi:circadian clock protein KaiB